VNNWLNCSSFIALRLIQHRRIGTFHVESGEHNPQIVDGVVVEIIITAVASMRAQRAGTIYSAQLMMLLETISPCVPEQW
jgi:hypothetical protein